jgi:broad specificity phosphatase PhoE
MHGYLRMRIAQFLTVIHPTEHTIYLTRHGQSEYNVLGKIGGNPPLSAAGAEFARRLAQWTAPHAFALRGRLAKCRLWTSSLQRTILTASHIPHPVIPYSLFGKPMASYEVRTALGIATPAEVEAHNAAMSAEAESALSNSPPRVRRPSSHAHDWSPSLAPTPVDLSMDADQDMPLLSGNIEQPRVDPVWHQCAPRVYRNLDEIFAGEYEGKTYEAVKALAPDEASLRARDKIGYRYPRGESYFDILARLDPLVHELESYHEPLVIVSHQAVLRLVYSYLKGYSRAKAPRIEIPLHTVIKITYDGWNPPHEERFFLGPKIDKTQEGQQNL